MKLPSTMTTVSGSVHHASLRRWVAGMGGRASVITRLMRSPRKRTRGGPLSLPGELLLPVLVQVTAVAIVEDDGRERLDLQSSDRFGAEILVGDDLEPPDVT